MSLGFAELSTWPHGFESTLDEIDRKNAVTVHAGTRGYGSLESFLRQKRKDPELERFHLRVSERSSWKLWQVLQSYKFDIPPTPSKLIGQFKLTERRWALIAESFGLSQPDLIAPVYSRETSNILSTVEKFLSETISQKEARNTLGIDGWNLQILDSSGLLRPVFRGENAADARYMESELSRFFDLIRGGCPLANGKVAGRASISEIHYQLRIDMAFLISALANRKLRAAGFLRGSSGIPAILMNTNEVRELWTRTGWPQRFGICSGTPWDPLNLNELKCRGEVRHAEKAA